MPIPIKEIATEGMGLTVKTVSITEDLAELGKIFFNDGVTDIYKPDTDEYVREAVTKGTVFIDENVFFERNVGCVRNTLAHECFHWYAHRHYYELQALLSNKLVVATRCPTKPISYRDAKSDVDWMEWQATNLAPRILMPKEMFMERARISPFLMREADNPSAWHFYDLEFAARDLADFFNVSVQSAEIRLRELGFED